MSAKTLLDKIALGSFISGAFVAVLGIVLVVLGSQGETEMSFFGQSFKSANVGVAAIFLGAALIVLNIRRILKSFDISSHNELRIQSGVKSPGQLVISDIQVTNQKEAKTCTIDFRVANQGGSELVVNRVEFEVLDTDEILTLGFMPFSKVYDLDISHLRQKGDRASCNVSQGVKPGETDRFGVTLIATQLGTGVFHRWNLRPTLHTSVGAEVGKTVEVWLPYNLVQAQAEARERFRPTYERWMSAMPTSMRLIWQDVIPKDFFSSGSAIKRLTTALMGEFPDPQMRIRALLSLFGSGAGPWNGFPSYEGVVEEMLLEYSTPELLAAMQNSPLNEQQVEGASRLLAGSAFRKHRPGDNALIPADLKRMLLEQSVKSSDQDKLARARSAFQD